MGDSALSAGTSGAMTLSQGISLASLRDRDASVRWVFGMHGMRSVGCGV